MTSRSLSLPALSAAFALIACGDVAPSLPAEGLTSERATEMAQPIAQSISATPVHFMSQETGQYRDFSGGLAVPGDSWVWVVVFHGTFHQAGGPAGAPPLPDQYSVSVIIDYRSGDFIEASISSDYSE